MPPALGQIRTWLLQPNVTPDQPTTSTSKQTRSGGMLHMLACNGWACIGLDPIVILIYKFQIGKTEAFRSWYK